MTDEQSRMLVETNTMVKMIYAELPKLATTERVNAVEDKAEHAYAKAASVHNEVVDHVKNHESMKVNTSLIRWNAVAGIAAILGVLYAIFVKKGS